MKQLTQRVRFKVCYIGNKDIQQKIINETIRRNSHETSVKNRNMLNRDDDILRYKDQIFKEIPIFSLSLEQYGTLELIEDYLLNKLDPQIDLHPGDPNNFWNIYRKKDNLDQQNHNINHEENEDKYQSPAKQQIKIDHQSEITQSHVILINLNIFYFEHFKLTNNQNFQLIYLQSKQNFQQSDITIYLEQLVVFNLASCLVFFQIVDEQFDAMRKTSINQLQQQKYETEIRERFKKNRAFLNDGSKYSNYLQIDFSINGKQLCKQSSLYSIMQNFCVNSNTNQQFKIEYTVKLQIREDNNISDKIYSVCNSKKNIAQRMVYSVVQKNFSEQLNEELQQSYDDSSIKTLQSVLQMFSLIHFLNDSIHIFRTQKNDFLYLTLKQLSNNQNIQLQQMFEQNCQVVQQEKIIKNLKNINYCSNLQKQLNDPLVLVGKRISLFNQEVASKSNYMMDHQSRILFVKNYQFHISRSLYYLYQSNKSKLKELEGSKIGKLPRKKIKIDRTKLITHGQVEFEESANKNCLVEFEFMNEEGSGLGPTLEFYAILVEELKKPELKCFRVLEDGTYFPNAQMPIKFLKSNIPHFDEKFQQLKQSERQIYFYMIIGQMIARAIFDERIIDLPMNPIFYKIVLDQPVYLEDVQIIDKDLGKTLKDFQEILNQKQAIEQNSQLSPSEKFKLISEIQYKGCNIEDLTLNFTFPGQPFIELIQNGADMDVTIFNLDQYVQLLVEFFFVNTLQSQIRTFRNGFESIIPLECLKKLQPQDINNMFCGKQDFYKWDIFDLKENIIPAHGFYENSQTFKNLLQVLTEFDDKEQQKFIKFITGCPRLPYGGFKNLNPKLTVVKKSGENSDMMLPSVMTCQNYLKIPEYSSIEILKNKLLYSMNEGQQNFTLS